jgi:hypothetical protein
MASEKRCHEKFLRIYAIRTRGFYTHITQRVPAALLTLPFDHYVCVYIYTYYSKCTEYLNVRT